MTFPRLFERAPLRRHSPNMRLAVNKLTFAAFSTTALLGALLLFLFIGYYPKFWTYMTSIFFPTYGIYAGLFFAETFTSMTMP